MTSKIFYLSILFAFIAAILSQTAVADSTYDLTWRQWAKDSNHTSSINVNSQSLNHVLASIVMDPHASAELADEGDIVVHYQSPLIEGKAVYLEVKGGTYTSSDPFTGVVDWNTETWNEAKYAWQNGSLQKQWTYNSDWKPVPWAYRYGNTYYPNVGPSWEPVFHAALTDDALYVPAAGGTIFKVNKSDGTLIARINPFGNSIDTNIFVVSPISADSYGNIYYTTIKFNGDPTDSNPNTRTNVWTQDVAGAWLVKITGAGTASIVDFNSITSGAISANSQCEIPFPYPGSGISLPVNPATDVAPTITCGSQRPALNATPAIASNGVIYLISRAQFDDRYGYLVAVNPDLTQKWIASFRNRFHDGCNILVPPNGTTGGCTAGTTTGVDPSTNNWPAGRVTEDSSASPTIAPDGSIFFGTYTRYNWSEGHLVHFSSDGTFLNSYNNFGWDTTPAIFQHGGTYSVIMKENYYDEVGSYCNDSVACPNDRATVYPNNPPRYFLSSFSPNLVKEWSWQNKNTLSCSRDQSGDITCVSDHPFGFEWCANAVAIDKVGRVFGASEDGNIYGVKNGKLVQKRFLNLSLGAAYTPTAIDSEGRVYGQNLGVLDVLGN